MPRKVDRGTGITAYEVTEYKTSAEDAPALSEAFDKSANAWNQAIKEGGGLFGAISLQAAQTCEKILRNANVERAPIDSPEDFAQVITRYITYAKNEIQAGDADRAARFAFEAGVEWATAKLKWGWEADALRGEKLRRNAREGHEAVHGDDDAKRARWRAMIDDVDAERARGALITEAHKNVAKKYGVSTRTIQRAPENLKKLLDSQATVHKS